MIERYFSQVVIHQGEIYRNGLLSLDGCEVILSPFERETQSTIFISGCIVVCATEKLNDNHLEHLDEIVKGNSIYDVLQDINHYINDNELYLDGYEKNQGRHSVTLIKYVHDIGWCRID